MTQTQIPTAIPPAWMIDALKDAEDKRIPAQVPLPDYTPQIPSDDVPRDWEN